jgi:hypothetical protein
MKWLGLACALGMAWSAPHVESRSVVAALTLLTAACLLLTRPRLRFDAPGTAARR